MNQEQKQIDQFIAQNKVTYCEPYTPTVRQISKCRSRKYSPMTPLKREELHSRVKDLVPRILHLYEYK